MNYITHLQKRQLTCLALICTLPTSLTWAAPTQPEAPPVRIETTQARAFPLMLEYPARTTGFREVEVRAQVSGIMQEKAYTEGSYVEKGQLLFRIDPRPYQAQLENAQGILAQQQARLRQTERDYRRFQIVESKGYASASTLDSARSNYEQTLADIQAAEGEVKARRVDLDYTTVKAPITGMTSREARSEGSLMIAGDPQYSMLTKITQLDPIYVNYAYPDHEGLWLRDSVLSGKLQTPPDHKLKAQIILSDGSNYPLPGQVDFTDSFIQIETGSVNARATVPNPERRLLPGQFVRIKLEGLVKPDAITLPQEAVAQRPQGTYVYVVDEQNIARIRPVTTGLTSGDRWLIETGLQPGERVIVEGIIKVQADQPVHIIDTAQP